VISSNLIGSRPISRRFRDVATYSLKLSIENCSQTAAYADNKDMVTIDSLWEVASALSDGTIADSTIYRLATIPHDRHTVVRYHFSTSRSMILMSF